MLAIDKGFIARWKIDTKFENWLGSWADNSEFAKVLYVLFYKLFDSNYYKKGEQIAKRVIDKRATSLPINKRKLLIDMIYSLHRFGCSFEEYFCFEFFTKNSIGRSTYLTDKLRYEYFVKMDSLEDAKILMDKNKTYALFADYFKRDVACVSSIEDKAAFIDFVKKHPIFIVKQCKEACGRGIEIMDISKEDVSLISDSLFEQLLDRGETICEELIVQSDIMASFHKSSVNTLRIPTVNCEDGVHLFSPRLRIGKGGAIVDNAGSGGLAAAIDSETGIVYTPGYDESNGKYYVFHPDSNTKIVGFAVPQWNEAVRMVLELASLLPKVRYISWDLAYTDKGWVLVEGNELGQIMADQMARQRGTRGEFESLMLKGKIKNEL